MQFEVISYVLEVLITFVGVYVGLILSHMILKPGKKRRGGSHKSSATIILTLVTGSVWVFAPGGLLNILLAFLVLFLLYRFWLNYSWENAFAVSLLALIFAYLVNYVLIYLLRLILP